MHHIHRITLEVDHETHDSTGHAAMNQASEWCRDHLPDTLAAALNPFDQMVDVLVIPRIDLSVNSSSLEEVSQLLIQQLEAAISRLIVSGSTSPINSTAHSSLVALPSEATEDIQHLRPDQVVFRAGIYFLIHGRYPWWFTKSSAGMFHNQFLECLVHSQSGSIQSSDIASEADPAILLRTLQEFPSARARFLAIFTSSEVLRMIALTSGDFGIIARELIAVLSQVQISASVLQHLVDALATILMGHIASGSIRLNDRSVAPSYGSSSAAGAVRVIHEAVAAAGARLAADDLAQVRLLLGIQTIDDGSAIADKTPSSQADDARPLPDVEVIGTEGLLVQNAGIILLHPFYPAFFESTGAAQPDRLLKPERAIVLLHMLATGSDEADEDELVFPKVLCGFPIEYVMPHQEPISQREREEADNLLNAAIVHWGALGGTSPDGLRGAFLTRPGRLDLYGQDWYVRVERQSYDVLLESLPWGLSHVKLPWMDRLMHLEWAL
ncbi:MAG: hypothetical protein FGM33_04130 [Candidatus Kapabacteria bacterium]|nr:hypothetical protein [Candidatus Kapabacteria bacterium]